MTRPTRQTLPEGALDATDRAILLGLAGHEPDQVEPEHIAPAIDAIRSQQRLALLGEHAVRFVEKEHLLYRRKSLPRHPNGMRFAALDAQGLETTAAEYFSIGGGFVVDAAGQRPHHGAGHACQRSAMAQPR